MNLWALFIPLIYYLLPSERTSRLILTAITMAFFVVDVFRLHVTGVKDVFFLLFGSFMRYKEHNRINGATMLMLGCLITALLYPKTIFVAAVTYIIVGDTFAALIGQTVKGPKFFRKTIIGSLSFFLSCAVCGLLMHFFLNFQNLSLLPLMIGAASATLLEAMPLPWDDNFSVPIFTGAIMFLI